MIQKTIVFGKYPVVQADNEFAKQKGLHSILVMMPIKDFWELNEILKNLKFMILSDEIEMAVWADFAKKIMPYIVYEQDQTWFRKYAIQHGNV